MRLCMERIAPALKDQPVSFSRSKMNNALYASEAKGSVLIAVREFPKLLHLKIGRRGLKNCNSSKSVTQFTELFFPVRHVGITRGDNASLNSKKENTNDKLLPHLYH